MDWIKNNTGSPAAEPEELLLGESEVDKEMDPLLPTK